MPMIEVICRKCDAVEVASREIQARFCEDNDQLDTYIFRCPRCRMIEVRKLEPHVADVLLAAGVMKEYWHLPIELFEKPPPERAAPIEPDDAIDFHDAITDDDVFTRAVQALKGAS